MNLRIEKTYVIFLCLRLLVFSQSGHAESPFANIPVEQIKTGYVNAIIYALDKEVDSLIESIRSDDVNEIFDKVAIAQRLLATYLPNDSLREYEDNVRRSIGSFKSLVRYFWGIRTNLGMEPSEVLGTIEMEAQQLLQNLKAWHFANFPLD